jgi:hypothetical protein
VLEQGDRATAVACPAEPVGAREGAPAHLLDILGGCEPQRELGQLRGGGGCSSRVHALCRPFDDGGDLAARLNGSEREMPRSLLRDRGNLGEPSVERPALRRCGTRPDRRAQQGVREAEPFPVDLEDSGLERVAQSRLCPAARGRLGQAHRRVRERRNDSRDLDPGSAEAIEALVNELLQVRGKGQLLARTYPTAASPERARELEGEERISARRFPDTQERRSGNGSAGARSQQLVQRTDAERAQLDGPEPSLQDTATEPEGHLVARGQDDGDRLCLEAGESEPEHRQRRCVEPLDVIDREQEPVADGELPQDAEEGERDHALVGGHTVGFRERKRGFERPPLWSRQLWQHIRKGSSDQIGQPDERVPGLCLGRTTGEHQIAALLGRLGSREPERRLADPGLTDDHGRCGQLLVRFQEFEESGELVLPAGEVGNADDHA